MHRGMYLYHAQYHAVIFIMRLTPQNKMSNLITICEYSSSHRDLMDKRSVEPHLPVVIIKSSKSFKSN